MKKLSKEYKNKIGIYAIINTINNKVYIGSSNNLYKRINDHFRELSKGNHCNQHLQNAFNLNKEYFQVEVISIFEDVHSLYTYEPLLIKLYKTYTSDNGYNILIEYKGTHGIQFTQERCRKISESKKGKVAYNKGIPMLENQKLLLQKVNAQRRGKPILIYDLNHTFLEELTSINEAIRKYNLDKRSTQRVLKGEYKHTKNLILKYKF